MKEISPQKLRTLYALSVTNHRHQNHSYLCTASIPLQQHHTCPPHPRAPVDPAEAQFDASRPRHHHCQQYRRPSSRAAPRRGELSTLSLRWTLASSPRGQLVTTPSGTRRWGTPSPGGECTAASVTSWYVRRSPQTSRSPANNDKFT